MEPFEPHLHCPPVVAWLRRDLPTVGRGLWSPPGVSIPRRIAKGLPPDEVAGPWQALVIVSRLGVLDAGVDEMLARVCPGGRVADIALPERRRGLGWFSSRSRSRALERARVDRLGRWLGRLAQVEQWVTVDPADAVVTLGRCP
jgi:hypothetical protein